MFDFLLDPKPINKDLDLLPLYDVIVIGAGPGGINASIYAKRKGLSVLLITKDLGGQMIDSTIVENFLGTPSTSGEKLNRQFLDHLISTDVPILADTIVHKVIKTNVLFILNLSNDNTINAKSLIIATGASPKKLGVKGEDEFNQKGIAYCAICDGPFYKNKDVIVVGGGNTALEIAIDLAKSSKRVTIIHKHKELIGDKALSDKLNIFTNINYIHNSVITEFKGEENLKRVIYHNKDKNTSESLNIAGAFISIGSVANSDLVKDLVEINEHGQIVTNNLQETSLEGLYAVGDVTNTHYKQIIVAASQGAVAALRANEFLKRKDYK